MIGNGIPIMSKTDTLFSRLLATRGDSAEIMGKRVEYVRALTAAGESVRSIAARVEHDMIVTAGFDPESLDDETRKRVAHTFDTSGLSRSRIGHYSRAYTLAVKMGMVADGDRLSDDLAYSCDRLARVGVTGSAIVDDTASRIAEVGEVSDDVAETFRDDVDTALASGKPKGEGKAPAAKLTALQTAQAALAAIRDGSWSASELAAILADLRSTDASLTARVDEVAAKRDDKPGNTGRPSGSTRSRSHRQVDVLSIVG